MKFYPPNLPKLPTGDHWEAKLRTRKGVFIFSTKSRGVSWRQTMTKMADTATNQVGNSYGEANDSQEIAFDLGVFVGDLNFEEDVSSDDISLEGLQKELEECRNDDVVANILSKGTKLREYTKGVENNLRQVELDSIQDYIKESDNLVSLHDQIRDCDSILSQMETLLSGFQEGMLIIFVGSHQHIS
uniref:Vps52 coiled-coil domain-containing protein n=1 Tax=Vitis vinifera TaxID=29760 RepID=A5AGN8_VITVI|nr:hypothetical protein VITISV_014747 [Vitis vinifera]